MNYQKWEYSCAAQVQMPLLMDNINAWGKEGWELVSFGPAKNEQTMFYYAVLKRLVPDEPVVLELPQDGQQEEGAMRIRG